MASACWLLGVFLAGPRNEIPDVIISSGSSNAPAPLRFSVKLETKILANAHEKEKRNKSEIIGFENLANITIG